MAELCALLALFGALVCVQAQSNHRPSPLVCAPGDCPKPATVDFVPSWVQLSPATSPSARLGAAIAYDAAHGQVVLFGGQGGPPDFSFLADTWTWNGNTWTQQSPAHSPPARAEAGMAYDAAFDQVVLFGGGGGEVAGALSDTWTWNGSSWTEQFPGFTPPGRVGPSMAYDAVEGRPVLFGGNGDLSNLNDTWTWNGSGWIAADPTHSPPSRYGTGTAYDAAQNQVVIFGGNSDQGDTWTWNGTDWTQQTPATSPPGRLAPGMAYDAALGQAVLFGGAGNSSALNDTWAWNGTTWTQLELLASPSARDFPSMVYDSAQNQMLLFGGSNGNGAVFGDTWALETGAVDLGTANVCPGGQTEPAPCSQSATLNFTISNGTVGSIGFVTDGAPNLDFQRSPLVGTCRAGSYTTPINCTVTVTFAPTAAGERNGAVVFYFTDGSVLTTQPVYGVGVAPQVVFSPSTQTTLGGGFSIQHGVAVDGAGNVYVADTGNNAVIEMPAGCASSSCATALGGTFIFDFPYGVAVDGSGNVYVAEYSGQAVNEIPAGCTSASCVTTLGGGFGAPAGVAVDGSGNVYVADEGNKAVYVMPPGCASSACVTTLGSESFSGPFGVAVDGNGNVFVADLSLASVFEMPANCASASCVTKLGGGFQTPTGVAIDASGNVYVSDLGAQGVFQIPANCASASCVTKLASEFSVLDLALDGSGNLYFSTGGGGVVHELNRSTPPSLTFDTTKGGQTSTDSPQTVTLQNVGNAKLTFFAVSYPADFPEQPSPPATDCSTAATLAPASDCTLSIDFSPLRTTTPGMLSESVRLTDNALNAAGAAQSVSVSGQGEMGTQASQTITFTPPASPVTFGVSPIALKATGGGSGNPVTFTIVSGPGKISGSTLTLTGVGTIVVAANQAGNASFTAATQVTATIIVNQGSQTIVFTPPASPMTFGVSPIALKATGGGSGNPVTFTIVSGPGSISGSTLTMTGLGTIVVAANQAGNANYTAAPQATATILVNQGSQTITFAAITSEVHAESTLKLSATASSELAVSFTSTTTAICTVSVTAAKLLAAGTCTIQASQAGNTDYAAAPTVSHSFTVLHASQNITFLAITAKEVALSKFKLVATASSKLAVSFASTTPKVCKVSDDEASLLASGTCTIVASQPGNNIFGAAKESRSFKVLPHAQSITFPAIANQTIGKSLTLEATASSKLAVSISSTTTAICKVSGTKASMLTAGTCTIKATQSGDLIYAAAPSVSRSFSVAK